MATTTKIKFGDYLNVTDEGLGVIRVDGCRPPWQTPPTVITGAYTTLITDVVVLAEGTTSYTVTLYSAAGNSGRQLTVKSTSTGTVTVDGAGSETIDGSATKTLATNAAVTLVSDGSNWFLIGAYP